MAYPTGWADWHPGRAGLLTLATPSPRTKRSCPPGISSGDVTDLSTSPAVPMQQRAHVFPEGWAQQGLGVRAGKRRRVCALDHNAIFNPRQPPPVAFRGPCWGLHLLQSLPSGPQVHPPWLAVNRGCSYPEAACWPVTVAKAGLWLSQGCDSRGLLRALPVPL